MFLFSETFETQNQPVSFNEVNEKIFPLLTAERQAKILEVIKGRHHTTHLVLDGIYDRGNVSAVLRSAEALGFLNVELIESQKKFKAANRVTSGADKWLLVRRWQEPLSLVAGLKEQGYKVVATSLSARAMPIDEYDFTKAPTALVLGNEKEGVSTACLKECDAEVFIPMRGFVQSFNISVALALCLYQIQMQFRTNNRAFSDLSPRQQDILRAHYAYRTLESSPFILAADKR